MNRNYRLLPKAVQAVLLVSEGYLVGSSVKTLAEGKTDFTDFDIIVPDRHKYHTALKAVEGLANGGYQFNSFGGMKFIIKQGIYAYASVPNITIDIWPEELSHFIERTNSRPGYAYQMRRNLIISYE